MSSPSNTSIDKNSNNSVKTDESIVESRINLTLEILENETLLTPSPFVFLTDNNTNLANTTTNQDTYNTINHSKSNNGTTNHNNNLIVTNTTTNDRIIFNNTQKSPKKGSNTNCPICMCPYAIDGPHRLVSLKCGHLFGHECITTWFKKKKTALCPTCSAKNRLCDVRIIYATHIVCEADNKHLEQLVAERTKVQRLKEQIRMLQSRLTYLISRDRVFRPELSFVEVKRIKGVMGVFDSMMRVYVVIGKEGVVRYDENFEDMKVLIPMNEKIIIHDLPDNKFRNDELSQSCMENDNPFAVDNKIINFNKNKNTLFRNNNNRNTLFRNNNNRNTSVNKTTNNSIINTNEKVISRNKENPTDNKRVESKMNIFRDIKVSPYNDGLILLALNNTVKLLNIQNSAVIIEQSMQRPVTAVCFDPLSRLTIHAADDEGNLYTIHASELSAVRVAMGRIHSLYKLNGRVYCATQDGVSVYDYAENKIYKIDKKDFNNNDVKNNNGNNRNTNCNTNGITNGNTICNNTNGNNDMSNTRISNNNMSNTVSKKGVLSNEMDNKVSEIINTKSPNRRLNTIETRVCIHMHGDGSRILVVERDSEYRLRHYIYDELNWVEVGTGLSSRSKKRDRVVGDYLCVINKNKLLVFEMKGLRSVIEVEENISDFCISDSGVVIFGESHLYVYKYQ